MPLSYWIPGVGWVYLSIPHPHSGSADPLLTPPLLSLPFPLFLFLVIFSLTTHTPLLHSQHVVTWTCGCDRTASGGCSDNNGGCQQLCVTGYRGHFYCRCTVGYVLTDDQRTCRGQSLFLSLEGENRCDRKHSFRFCDNMNISELNISMSQLQRVGNRHKMRITGKCTNLCRGLHSLCALRFLVIVCKYNYYYRFVCCFFVVEIYHSIVDLCLHG